MRPILFSVWLLHISSYGFFITLGFLVGTFLIWRMGRDSRLSEDKIIDSVFTSAVYAFLAARLLHVVFHFNVFSPSLLRFFLIWKFPGLSLVGGFIGGLVGIIISSKRAKFTFWQLFDLFAISFLPFFALSAIGGLLDGAEVGKPTTMLWGVPFAGYTEFRHPLGLYEMIFAIFSYAVFSAVHKRFEQKKRPFGVTALLIYATFSFFLFGLAFLKEGSVYLMGLDFNQTFFGVSACASIVFLYLRFGRNILFDAKMLFAKIKAVNIIKK